VCYKPAMRHAWSAALCCVLFGCGQPAADHGASAPSPEPRSSGAERAFEGDSLAGLWVEFWALEGQADTQRYALFEDGRFGWRAAPGDESDVLWRWGTWTREDGALALRVEGEERGGACEGDACRVRLDPPREERLPVGECPPNDEASTLDPSYRCVSLAGQAFWRRPQAGSASAFLPY
jgi:hypothetical protein